MRAKEACILAYNNIKGKKKTGRALGVMIFFSLFIYLFINSVALSVNDVVTLFDEVPIAKNIIYEDLDDDLAEKFKNIEDEVEHVVDVYKFVYPIPVSVSGIEADEDLYIEIKSCSDNYEEYIVEGKLPSEGEILLPHYLFAEEDGQYVDGSKYIGEEITVYVTNYFNEEKSVKFVVSGTYDNIYSVMGTYTALANADDAIKVYDLSEEGIEKKLEQKMEETGNYDKSFYIGYENQYYYSVVVDDVKNINIVRKAISDKYSVSGYTEFYTDDNVLETIFPLIHLVCIGISMVLLIVVVVMMMSMIGNDINNRRKEMAIYLVQGYSKSDLMKVLGIEYVIRLIPSLVFSIIATLILLFTGNLLIEKFMSMEYKILELSFATNGLLAAFVMMLIVWIMAIYTINDRLRKIDLLKEIKSEG